MKIVSIVVFVVIILTAGPLYNHLYRLWKARQLVRAKYAALRPLLEKLARKESITLEEVQPLALNPSVRVGTFRLLDEYGRTDLFPAEMLTQEKGAEAFLVNWLEYPTELGRAPDRIELLEQVAHDGDHELGYFVFQFMTLPPHWAAKKGWMLGVSGPYSTTAKPYDEPLLVFSRFSPVGTESAATEVKWVHENLNPK